MSIKKKDIINILISLLWISIGGMSVFLLVAAAKVKSAKKCTRVDISIDGGKGDFFIDKTDVSNIIRQAIKSEPVGTPVSEFNLRTIEAQLEKDIWIKNAEVFFDNNNVLSVDVKERQPIARVFSLRGSSFYLDTTAMVLPLSDKFSARLPIFTGFAGNELKPGKSDSVLLSQIQFVSRQIVADTFLMAMVEQVDITPSNTFRLIPKVGKQIIEFGDAADSEKKFEKLKLFYKNIVSKAGWDRYSIINLQFNNQVVAKIRGQEDKTADSLRTMQLLEMIAANAAQQAADSTRLSSEANEKVPNDISIIEESKERDDIAGDSAVPMPKPPVVQQPLSPAASVPPAQVNAVASQPVRQPAPATGAVPAQQRQVPKPNVNRVQPKPAQAPRAVMPPKPPTRNFKQ